MNSHVLQLVDRIDPKIFIVGFNPLVYKDSGLKARWFGGRSWNHELKLVAIQ